MEVKKCGMKRDPEKRRESEGIGKGSRSSSPRRNSLGRGSPKGTSPSGNENQSTCYAFKGDVSQKDMPVIIGIHLGALCIIEQETANLDISVCIQAYRQAWRRPEKAKSFCGSRQNVGYHLSRGRHHNSMRSGLFCMMCQRLEINLQQVGKTNVE